MRSYSSTLALLVLALASTPLVAHASPWPSEGLTLVQGQRWYDDVRFAPDGDGSYVAYEYGYLGGNTYSLAQRFTLTAAVGTVYEEPTLHKWPVADGENAFFSCSLVGSTPGEIRVYRVLGGTPVGAWPDTGIGYASAADPSPEIAADSAGGAFLVSANTDVRLLRLAPDGSTALGWPDAGLPLSAALPSLGTLPHPRLHVDGEGRAVVLYLGAANDLRTARVLPDGSLDGTWAGGALAAFSSPADQPFGWSLAADANGYWIVWGSANGLNAVRLDANGVAVPGTAVLALPVATNPELEPGTIVTFSDGLGGLFAFCAAGTQGGNQSASVLATHLTASGAPASGWSVPGVPLALPGGSTFSLPSFVAGPDGAGGAFFGWPGSLTHFTSAYALAPGWAAAGDPLTFPGLQANGPCGSGGLVFTAPLGVLADSDGLPLVAVSARDNCTYPNATLKLARFVPTGIAGVAPASSRGALALRLAGANPASGARRFALALGTDAPATLEVLDVAGRVVSHAFVSPGVGSREVAWSRPAGVPAGVYFARLTQRGATATTRFIELE